jgi:hypothetical protein
MFRNDIIKGGRACITGIVAYIADFLPNFPFGSKSHFSVTALANFFNYVGTDKISN